MAPEMGTEVQAVQRRMKHGPEDHTAGQSERLRGDSTSPIRNAL